MLVNTVANTALKTPLVVLSVTLFALLVFASLVVALRIHLMDLFSRRFYSRMVSEIALRTIYAVDPYFNNAGKTALFNRYFAHTIRAISHDIFEWNQIEIRRNRIQTL